MISRYRVLDLLSLLPHLFLSYFSFAAVISSDSGETVKVISSDLVLDESGIVIQGINLFINGKLTLIGSTLEVSQSSSLDVSGVSPYHFFSSLITADLELDIGSTLIIDSPSSVTVDGCVNLAGTLNITNQNLNDGDEVRVLFLELSYFSSSLSSPFLFVHLLFHESDTSSHSRVLFIHLASSLSASHFQLIHHNSCSGPRGTFHTIVGPSDDKCVVYSASYGQTSVLLTILSLDTPECDGAGLTPSSLFSIVFLAIFPTIAGLLRR